MTILEERIAAVNNNPSLSPPQKRRRIARLRQAHKDDTGTSVTKTKTKTNGGTTKKVTTPKRSKFGVGSNKTVNGKANVSAEQLKQSGMSLRQYMNAWKADPTGKRPTGKRPTVNTDSRSRVDRGSQRNTRKVLSAEERRQRDANRNKTTTPRNQSASGNLRAAQRASLKKKEKDAMEKRMANQPVMAGKVDRRNPSASSSLREAQKEILRREEEEAMRKRMATQPVMGRGLRGGGMVKKTGMKKGGMVKKTGMRGGGMVKKTGMKKGGLVKARGAGKAQRGVRPAKMR